MELRIAVLGAGGPAGVNVCRALQLGGHDVVGIDDEKAHLVWCEPFCVDVGVGKSYLGEFDVIHAQPEPTVRWLAGQGLPKLMPTPEVIDLCQDKARTVERWAQLKLRTRAVEIGPEIPDHLLMAADTFGTPFWLRAKSGAGAKGATLVDDLRTGYHWIRYWQTTGADLEWVAEEYLPGRDYCWSSLWHDGVLVAAFARERLEWIYPQLTPTGRTGTPSISVTVHNPDVNQMGFKAVRTIDGRPNGIYCVDLREDTDGVLRPTEINAGRWATTTPLYSELGVNLPDLHARLAVGEDVETLGDDIYPAGIRLSRHIDCGHIFSEVPVCA
jgi:biotin carboxylase